MPDFGMWDPKSGDWVIANHGVDPDIEVENPPDALVAGHDPQLERGIRYCMDELKSHPPHEPPRVGGGPAAAACGSAGRPGLRRARLPCREIASGDPGW